MVESSSYERFGEPVKFLPVTFVSVIIFFLYFVYMYFHIGLLLADPDLHMQNKGFWQAVVFNIVTVLLVTCYLRCILVHPGAIPTKEEDPSWEYVPRDATGSGYVPWDTQEMKRSGDRRHCKWCTKFKPDRCHHCRVCKTCILKMDHHCPWIYNCVGFRNYKYFFLLLFYTVVNVWLIVCTMWRSVTRSTTSDIPFTQMFCLLFGETLAGFLSVLITGFFSFHVYLMQKAMTTIEFCEKQMKRTGLDSNAYDRGVVGNAKAVLGDNYLTWLLPWDPPHGGQGLTFLTEETKLIPDTETGYDNWGRSEFGETGDSLARRRDAGTGSAPSDGDVEGSVVSDPLGTKSRTQ